MTREYEKERNISVNEYLSNVIQEQKMIMNEKDKNNEVKQPQFSNINDHLGKLDITV
jgi:hypothetical protein